MALFVPPSPFAASSSSRCSNVLSSRLGHHQGSPSTLLGRSLSSNSLSLCEVIAVATVVFRSRRALVQRRVYYKHARKMRDKLYRPETAIASAPKPMWSADGGVRICSGVSELSKRYDAFTLDQYGVLHDGRVAYPGVADALEQLKAAGKPAVILSNYAGRAASQAAKLPEIGLDPQLLAGIVTSGELAYRYLKQHQGKLGRRVLWIAWQNREKRGLGDFFDGLEDYELVSDAKNADFILVSGVDALFAGTEDQVHTTYEADGDRNPFMVTFRQAIQRCLPMICANPDLRVVRPEGWKAYLGGSLAQEYENLGGRVIYFGKPYTAAFEEARRLLQEALSEGGKAAEDISICHVGDSLHHDVSGAAKVGLNAAFVVKSGLHADEFRGENEKLTSDAVIALCRKEEAAIPQVAIPSFTW